LLGSVDQGREEMRRYEKMGRRKDDNYLGQLGNYMNTPQIPEHGDGRSDYLLTLPMRGHAIEQPIRKYKTLSKPKTLRPSSRDVDLSGESWWVWHFFRRSPCRDRHPQSASTGNPSPDRYNWYWYMTRGGYRCVRFVLMIMNKRHDRCGI
jgi:hypothetical protein